MRPSHPTRPIFRQLAPDLAGEALVLLTPNSGQTPLFRGALVAFTGTLLRGPQFRSGSALGPVSRPPPRIAAPGRFFGSPWWPPPSPCSVALNCGLAAWVGIPPPPPNSGPRPLFRGALVAPAGGLLRGPQLRSGSEGRYTGPPNSGPRPLFRGALVAPAGVLLRGPQLRSGSEGRYPGPPNSGPRPLFRAPARGLLRGPQFRIAWLSVATGTIVVRRNKYRFRILHIYALKLITWQPSTIQTDGERQWAERVLCLIGGPRETVYSDCSSLDRRAKMSTSRKPRAKLAKHRRSARKEPEPEPAERSTAETQASTERGTVAAGSALTGTQFVCFCHWLSGQKLFAGLSLFTCTFQSLRRARRAHRDRRRLEPLGHGNAPREQVGRAVCLSHSPSEIWPNTHSVFFSRSQQPQEKKAPSHRRRP